MYFKQFMSVHFCDYTVSHKIAPSGDVGSVIRYFLARNVKLKLKKKKSKMNNLENNSPTLSLRPVSFAV